jgi:hypothetical protein
MPASIRVRLSVVLAASAVGAILAPALPAAAAPSQPTCAMRLTGSASADLVRLDTLNLHTLGVLDQPGAGLRVASTRVTATPTKATATARGVDTSLAGLALAGPPPVATQQAPPTPAQPGAAVTSPPADLGVARVGTGSLRARADCPSASSSVSLADATVLPAHDGVSVLSLPNDGNSATSLGLVQRNQHPATMATAQIGLTELHVFDRTNGTVTVRVLSQPSLTAIAGGTRARSSVRYTSPVLEVTFAGARVQRLDAVDRYLDLVVSDRDGVSAAGTERALTESVPGNPLAQVFGRPAAPGAPGTPASPVVLRLSIGTLSQRISDTSVTASAATLRIQLRCAAGVLLDLGVGVLETTATAPMTESVGGGGGGTLPLTGPNVGLLVGLGLLIAIAGRFLLVLAHKRAG